MKGRYNITLTPELDERLNQYSYTTRKSRSALIEEALNQYLSGPVQSLPIIHNDEISMLKERIDIIESKIRNIEKKESTDCVIFQSIKEDVPEVIPPIVTEITNIFPPSDESSQRTQNNSDTQAINGLDPEGWYAQYEVVVMLDPSIPLNTRKGWVSKAVSSGKLETNGEKGKECMIKGSSAIEWIKLKNQKTSESE